MLLKNKVAVITGAASGIGQATAILFAREGAKVICSDIDDKMGRETMDMMRQQNLDASYHHMDVRNSGQIAALARECAKNVGRVDVLFNNAGRSIKQTFEETTEDAWREMISIHLSGVFLCSKHFLPLMKNAPRGSIINHASVDAILGNASIAAYSASKGGLIPLTHVMAHNLGKYNIRVNCLASGGISTATNARPPETYQSRISVTPLQRTGTSEEVASVALFFASDLSSYVNGATLVVDGGRTAITQGTYHGMTA